MNSKIRIYESKTGKVEIIIDNVDSTILTGIKAFFKAIGSDVETCTIAGEDSLVSSNIKLEALPKDESNIDVNTSTSVTNINNDLAENNSIIEEDLSTEMAAMMTQIAETLSSSNNDNKESIPVKTDEISPSIVKITNYDTKNHKITVPIKKMEYIISTMGIIPIGQRDISIAKGAKVYTINESDAILLFNDETASKGIIRL